MMYGFQDFTAVENSPIVLAIYDFMLKSKPFKNGLSQEHNMNILNQWKSYKIFKTIKT